MQLIKLHIIDRYNDLENFTLNFSEKITLLVGINGSGKSSVLEAISKIISWSNLIYIEGKKDKKDIKIKPEFGFELVYLLRFEETIYETSTTSEIHANYPLIKIEGQKDNFKSIKILIDEGQGFIKYEKSQMYKKFTGDFKKILPANVIIYYSGVSESMHRLCNIHEGIFSTKLRDFETPEIRALFYFTPSHFKYLLLSLLSFEFGPIPDFLNKEIRISDINEIVISLNRPSWGKSNAENYWNATGKVRQFLDFLKIYSLNFEVSERDSMINITLNLDGLIAIRQEFIEERELFRLFDIAHYDGLIKDVSINLVHKDTNMEFDYKSLSEGEQQLITILGLNELLITENSLALMDEPDSYLHPSRQRELMPQILNRFNDNCQIIVTTHSPFVAQSVSLKNILVFDKNERSPQVIEQDLLSYPSISEGIFGIKSDFSDEIENDLNKFRSYRDRLLMNKEIEFNEFEQLVTKLSSYGEEVRVNIAREISQLKRLEKI